MLSDIPSLRSIIVIEWIRRPSKKPPFVLPRSIMHHSFSNTFEVACNQYIMVSI